jgi:hypothetical protein
MSRFDEEVTVESRRFYKVPVRANEAFTVAATCVRNEDSPPLQSTPETQPQLRPALPDCQRFISK